MSQTLFTCDSCHREWDGNAQCPCGINYKDDYEYLSLSDSDREDIGTPEVKYAKTKDAKTKDAKTKDAKTKDASTQTDKTPLELAQEAVNELFVKNII